MTPQEIVVERAPINTSHRTVKRIQRASAAAIALAFLLAVAALPLFFYTFWVLLEVLVRTQHLPRGTSILGRAFPQGFAGLSGWPFDGAFVLSTLAAWSLLYLTYDHGSLCGNRSLQDALASQVEKVLGSPPTTSAFFVELRPPDGPRRLSDRLRPDIGWLVPEKDRWVFVGDSIVVTIPNGPVGRQDRPPTLDGNRLGLSSAWVRIPVSKNPKEDIRLLVRDDASRLSDTARGARRLLKALKTPPASTEPVQP